MFFVFGGNFFFKIEDGKVVIDWDGFSVVDIWKELIRIFKEIKKVKVIGVFNFNVEFLEKFIKEIGVVFIMN